MKSELRKDCPMRHETDNMSNDELIAIIRDRAKCLEFSLRYLILEAVSRLERDAPVKCERCKYWEIRMVRGEEIGFCNDPNMEYHAQATCTEASDFCSNGEPGEPSRTVWE